MFKKDGLNKRSVELVINGKRYTATVITALNDDIKQSADYGEKFYDIIDLKENQTQMSANYETAAKAVASSYRKIKYADMTSNMLTLSKKQRIVNNRNRESIYNSKEDTLTVSEWKQKLQGKQFPATNNDEQYRNAVESGNTSVVEKMVRDTAKDWGAVTDKFGVPQIFYHGSKNFGFSVYDMDLNTDSKGMIYATSKSNVALNYGRNKHLTFVRNINRKLRSGNLFKPDYPNIYLESEFHT